MPPPLFLFLVEKFQSSLPGGSICDSGKRRLYCILDAIIDKDTQRLFILDILCWNSQPVYECDSEFRNYWRMSKLAEVDVFRIHAQNKFAFQIVEVCPPVLTITEREREREKKTRH